MSALEALPAEERRRAGRFHEGEDFFAPGTHGVVARRSRRVHAKRIRQKCGARVQRSAASPLEKTKTLVNEAKDGKAATITLTPTTAGADAVAALVGKSVKVVSEHGKADSVAAGT